MPTWYVFALLSVFGMAGSEIVQKISHSQKIKLSAITNNFFIWTLQGIFGLVLALIINQTFFEFSTINSLKLLTVATVYFFGGTFFYTSYKGNSPSLSIVIGSISVVISTFLGILTFDEGASIDKFIGILLILISIFIANYNAKERFNRYNLFAFAGGILFGLAYTLDKSFAIESSPILYVSILSFSVAIVSLFFKHQLINRERKNLQKRNYYFICIIAIFGTLFNFFTFMSYSRGGDVGVVDAINNSAVLLVLLLEIILLKDRTNLFRKLLASTIVLIGITLLSTVE